MQTATACRKFGLKPILYLTAIVEPKEEDLRSNLLLDKVLGAQIHLISTTNITESEADSKALVLAKEHIKQLESKGHKCYLVPMGGASPVGAAGFISGFCELDQQLKKLKMQADYLFHATGTGSTLAGLISGKKLVGSTVSIHSINVNPKPVSHYKTVAQMAIDALAYFGVSDVITENDLYFDQNYFAPGYEAPNEKATKAIKLLARKEGIFLDPVYTGKGFAGMLDYIYTGKIPQGSTVIYWHTGGATALFAEKAIVGNIATDN